MTREQWLNEMLIRLYHRVFAPAGIEWEVGTVRVSCSWPGGGSARKRIGECWPRSYSSAGRSEIFISPAVDDPVQALDILVHEMIHSSDNCASGHKGYFRRVMKLVGLEGKATASHAGPALRETLQKIATEAPYPHARLDLSARKKQTTRNIKHECGGCGAVWRMAAVWTVIYCPCCGSDINEVGQDATDSE